MKTLISSILLLLMIISCGDTSEEKEMTQDTFRDSTATFGYSNFIFPKLSKNAEQLVAEWPIFEDFQIEATSVNGRTIQELRVQTPRLLAHTDSLSKKIPDSLNTRPIASRLIIVKTRAQLLNQVVNGGSVDSVKLQDALNEMNLSVRDFIMQLNGKLQKDAIDFQRKDNEKKELEKQRRFLDSVFQSELKDNLDDRL